MSAPEIPNRAVRALCVPLDAIDALCDASSGVYRADLEAAVRETVAPLLVAAELRRLAVEHAADPVAPRTSLGDLFAAHLCAALRERAAELDGGEPR